MSRRLLLLASVPVALAVALPVNAQTTTASGMIPAGSDGAGVALAFETGWNEGEYSCNADVNELQVVCLTGACADQRSRLFFKVIDFSTSAEYSFTYEVDGSTGVQRHTLSFAGQPPQVLAPGYNSFLIPVPPETEGGAQDVISVKYDPTNEVGSGFGAPAVPALGAAAATAALLLLGGALAWRLS